MKHDVSVIQNNYLLFLQKKCQTRNKGSLRASNGKYLTSLISRYTLWRLCPSCDLPNRFRASCFPKFPASSTSFNTNLPYFSRGRHAEHLLHDIHNGTGKHPQSQLLQFCQTTITLNGLQCTDIISSQATNVDYSTVTLFARFLGISTSSPLSTAT